MRLISFCSVLIFLFSDTLGRNCDKDGNHELLQRLQSLRNFLNENKLLGYIIPHGDEHNSEYPSPSDQRLAFISGFTGSAGIAIVTNSSAVLWTDSRYEIQAGEELPCEWTYFIKDYPQSPSIKNWLGIQSGELVNVGFDPMMITIDQHKSFQPSNTSRVKLVSVDTAIIDKLWTDRPSYSKDPIYVHELEFAGETYERKIEKVRQEMEKENEKVTLLVISQLDEIAWLFNLRGNDVEITPVFQSYALLSLNRTALFVMNPNVTAAVRKHLSQPSYGVEILPYHQFWEELRKEISDEKKILIPKQSNFKIYQTVGEKNSLVKASPIINLRAVKNPTEIQGSRNAHIREAIVMCQLFKTLEEEVPAGIRWDELKVTAELDRLRSLQKHYKSVSFNPIIGFGSNGAIVHYAPSIKTNSRINTTAPLLIDIGGQYLDGTTDTTRVLHLGDPTDFQKEVYTSLLKGVADLADTVFPDGTTYTALDMFSRRHLLQMGLTFGHGTTHGTGIFLSVHERYNSTYFDGFIGSQEPGYYLHNQFGMRLENLVVVVPAPVQNEFNPKKLLAFSPLTLVPYEKKLIDLKLMDKSQIIWLNKYHENVRRDVGKEMITQKLNDLYRWLLKKTAAVTLS